MTVIEENVGFSTGDLHKPSLSPALIKEKGDLSMKPLFCSSDQGVLYLTLQFLVLYPEQKGGGVRYIYVSLRLNVGLLRLQG